MYNSDAKQDLFVSKILQNKKNGTYLDIGSCHSSMSNNTFYFDNFLSWRGICVEINSEFNESYSARKNCLLINDDATKLDYKKIFYDLNFPKTIDYLSLDVDTASLDVLKLLPITEYKFNVITIEHDYYLYGDSYREPQRKILEENGYLLICGDVFVQQYGFDKPNCSFEDWWVKEDFLEKSTFDKIVSQNIYPSDFLTKF
jgi:hypothetical protein